MILYDDWGEYDSWRDEKHTECDCKDGWFGETCNERSKSLIYKKYLFSIHYD